MQKLFCLIFFSINQRELQKQERVLSHMLWFMFCGTLQLIYTIICMVQDFVAGEWEYIGDKNSWLG